MSKELPKQALDAKVGELMDQAQIYASTWSLAGSRWDNGTLYKAAEDEKKFLETAIRAAIAPPVPPVPPVPLEPTTGNWVAADDVQRMALELDVAMNGEEGAATSPSLCDVVSQAVEKLRFLAQPVQPMASRRRLYEASRDAAVDTLMGLGYEYFGASQWRPPVPQPDLSMSMSMSMFADKADYREAVAKQVKE